MKDNLQNLIFIVDDDPDDRQIILDAFLENSPQIDYVFIENAESLMEKLHSGCIRLSGADPPGFEYARYAWPPGAQGDQGQ